jgi:hypothetical protein
MTDVTVNADGDVSSINEKRSWKDFLSAKNPFEGLAGKIKSVGSAALVSLDDWASGKNKHLAFLKQFEGDTCVSAHRVSTDRDFGVNEWNSVVFYAEPENSGDEREEHYIAFSHKNDALGYASALRMAVTDPSVMDAHESSIRPPAASEAFDHTESEPQVSEVSGPEYGYTDIHAIAAKMRRPNDTDSAITAEEIDALLERDKPDDETVDIEAETVTACDVVSDSEKPNLQGFWQKKWASLRENMGYFISGLSMKSTDVGEVQTAMRPGESEGLSNAEIEAEFARLHAEDVEAHAEYTEPDDGCDPFLTRTDLSDGLSEMVHQHKVGERSSSQSNYEMRKAWAQMVRGFGEHKHNAGLENATDFNYASLAASDVLKIVDLDYGDLKSVEAKNGDLV